MASGAPTLVPRHPNIRSRARLGFLIITMTMMTKITIITMTMIAMMVVLVVMVVV